MSKQVKTVGIGNTSLVVQFHESPMYRWDDEKKDDVKVDGEFRNKVVVGYVGQEGCVWLHSVEEVDALIEQLQAAKANWKGDWRYE